MGYSRHAFTGFSAQSLQKTLVFGLNFIKIFILARLLNPNDFGLFSLTMIAIGITESFTQTGINTTIVQSKRSIAYFLDTAWVIAIIRGFIIGLIMLALAFFMKKFYGQELLLPLVAVAALVPVIKGFINPAIANWQKKFHFTRESFYHSTHLVIEVLAQLALAYWLRSVWALLLGVLVGAIFEVLLSFLMNQEKPHLNYYPSRAKTIFKQSKSLGLASILAYLNDNADDFILGKLVGTHQLGLYHNAYSLSHKTNYELSKSAHHSLMPIFSQLDQQKHQNRLSRAFKRSLFSSLILGLVISLPLLIWPEKAIALILGDQWLAASNIIRVLVLAGLTQSIANISYAFLIAKKHYFFMNAHLSLSLFLMVAGILFLTPTQGLFGACLAILLARILSLPLIIIGLKQSLKGD